MGFSWHLAENGFAVSGFLSPFCACRSAQTREMHDTATLLSSLHKIQNFPLKKKKKKLGSSQPAAASCPGWFFHKMLLGAVICYWCLGDLPPLWLPGEPVFGSSFQVISWLNYAGKNVGFLAFCPFPSPADERELLMHKNIQFAFKLPLPSISSPQNVVILQFWVLTNGWCATTLPVSSSHIPAC